MAFTAPVTRATDFLVTAAIWNAEHVDNFNTGVQHLAVRKTSDQSVTSSTTLVDDSALVLPVLASEIWQFKFFVVYGAGATGDIKVAFTFPTGGDFRLSLLAADAAGTLLMQTASSTTSPTPTISLKGNGITTYATIPFEGVYVNGGTGGNVTLQFAQVVSDATAATIKAQSTLWGVKLA